MRSRQRSPPRRANPRPRPKPRRPRRRPITIQNPWSTAWRPGCNETGRTSPDGSCWCAPTRHSASPSGRARQHLTPAARSPMTRKSCAASTTASRASASRNPPDDRRSQCRSSGRFSLPAHSAGCYGFAASQHRREIRGDSREDENPNPHGGGDRAGDRRTDRGGNHKSLQRSLRRPRSSKDQLLRGRGSDLPRQVRRLSPARRRGSREERPRPDLVRGPHEGHQVRQDGHPRRDPESSNLMAARLARVVGIAHAARKKEALHLRPRRGHLASIVLGALANPGADRWHSIAHVPTFDVIVIGSWLGGLAAGALYAPAYRRQPLMLHEGANAEIIVSLATTASRTKRLSWQSEQTGNPDVFLVCDLSGTRRHIHPRSLPRTTGTSRLFHDVRHPAAIRFNRHGTHDEPDRSKAFWLRPQYRNRLSSQPRCHAYLDRHSDDRFPDHREPSKRAVCRQH